MPSITEKRITCFLNELTALTRKHKIEIGGCGCCGSPGLEMYSPDDPMEGKYEYRDRTRGPNIYFLRDGEAEPNPDDY